MGKPNKLCNDVDAIKFIADHLADCTILAGHLQVPVENILGLAAEESQWGTGRIASTYNNYFSMHAPAPGQLRDEPAQQDPKTRVAVFRSFLDGGNSFVTKWGKYVQGKNDLHAFAGALVEAKYNSGDSKTGGRDGFAEFLAGIIETVKVRIKCPT